MSASVLDRRTFLGSLSLAGVGLFAGWPALSLAAASSEDALRHVDDVWGHWPRYAHPIPYCAAQVEPLPWEQIDPADRTWAAWL
jgi:hypothetical protein